MLSDLLKGKSDTVVFCDLSEVQRELYLNVLSLPEYQLLKRCGGGMAKPDESACVGADSYRARQAFTGSICVLSLRGRATAVLAPSKQRASESSDLIN